MCSLQDNQYRLCICACRNSIVFIWSNETYQDLFGLNILLHSLDIFFRILVSLALVQWEHLCCQHGNISSFLNNIPKLQFFLFQKVVHPLLLPAIIVAIKQWWPNNRFPFLSIWRCNHGRPFQGC